MDRMIRLVEAPSRQKLRMKSRSISYCGLTIIFLLAVATLQPFAVIPALPNHPCAPCPSRLSDSHDIGGLLSAIGIAGMDRSSSELIAIWARREASGDVDVLLLDKTGTITLGNREATLFCPCPNIKEMDLASASQLASFADETPEGRSIVVLAKEKYGLRGRELAPHSRPLFPSPPRHGCRAWTWTDTKFGKVRRMPSENTWSRTSLAVPAEIKPLSGKLQWRRHSSAGHQIEGSLEPIALTDM